MWRESVKLCHEMMKEKRGIVHGIPSEAAHFLIDSPAQATAWDLAVGGRIIVELFGTS
jgi:hypothetical protein